MRMLAFIAVPVALAACHASGADSMPGTPVQPSGSGASRTYPASGFTAVDLTAVDDVAIRTGGAFSVRAEGEPATLDQLRITRDGNTLHVGRKPGASFSGRGAKVFVTMPTIAEASVEGTGDLSVDRVTGRAFAADLSGTGNVRVGQAAVDRVTLHLSGSGDMTIAGRTQILAAHASGTGGIDARGLAAASAEVDASGTGDVKAAVNGPAQVSASGTGDVDLGPRARCTTHKSGTGDVTCGG